MTEDLLTDYTPQPVPLVYPVSRLQRVRSLLSFLMLVLAGYLGALVMMGPFIPLAFFAPSLFLTFMDCGVHLWTMLCEVLLSGILRVQVRLFGDKFIYPSSIVSDSVKCGSSIVLLNHRTRLDWLFIYAVGRYARHLKVVLKQQLAMLPGVGWAMQLNNFIFLKRKISVDQARINQALEYLLRYQGHANILLFPEGTNLFKNAIKKSDEFAEKTGRPKYRYTLHPRITGFERFVRVMGTSLNYVYDVTVAYPYALPETELQLTFGNSPQEVHFYVRRWNASDLPLPAAAAEGSTSTSSALGKWLDQCWSEKEGLLKQYYALPPEERRFPAPEISREGSVIGASVDDEWTPQACIVLAFWVFFVFLSLSIIYYSWMARLYLVAMSTFFVYQTRKTGLGEWVAELAGVPLISDDATSSSGSPVTSAVATNH